MPGGVVVRINHDPIRTEYLSLDDPPEWSVDRDKAFFFARYEGDSSDGSLSATAFAEFLRARTGEHVFPAVREKPMAFRSVPDPIAEPEIAAVRESDRPLNSPARRRKAGRPRGTKNEVPATPAPRAASGDDRAWYRQGQMA